MANILIADDDPVTLNFLKSVVTGLGHTPFLCRDGLEAWEALQKNSFDLFIMDVVMPGFDGRELMNLIQRDRSLANMPVVIISGVVSESDVSDLLDLNATWFVAKPIRRDELEGLIALSVPPLSRGSQAQVVSLLN